MPRPLATLLLAALLASAAVAEAPAFLRYGTMHEAIGQGRSQGRVAIADVCAEPHIYALGALAGLAGEVTILDSQPVLTGVSPSGRPVPFPPADAQATMLAGRSVPAWDASVLHTSVPAADFDATITAALRNTRLDVAQPTVFLLEGEFTDVRLHTLNGACPVHARMKAVELPPESRPFELETATLRGTLLGIHAVDSVGKLTHPATTTHAHLVYRDPQTGDQVTAHVERAGVAAGAALKLPRTAESAAAPDSTGHLFAFRTDVDLWGDPGPDPVFAFEVVSASLRVGEDPPGRFLDYDIVGRRQPDEYEGEVENVSVFYAVFTAAHAALDSVRLEAACVEGEVRFQGSVPLARADAVAAGSQVTLELYHWFTFPTFDLSRYLKE